MENPQKLQNTDRSPNTGGGLKYFTELKVITRETPHLLCFYIADMGLDDLVLGYPWSAATNTHLIGRQAHFLPQLSSAPKEWHLGNQCASYGLRE